MTLISYSVLVRFIHIWSKSTEKTAYRIKQGSGVPVPTHCDVSPVGLLQNIAILPQNVEKMKILKKLLVLSFSFTRSTKY